MGGGQIQLAAIGPQDIYLTGNPQITYFKAVYKRHTNFLQLKLSHYLLIIWILVELQKLKFLLQEI